jgi:membrane protease YdiL (CAAX protease family)
LKTEDQTDLHPLNGWAMSDTTDRGTIVGLAILVEGGLIVLAWMLGFVVDERPFRQIDLDAMDVLRGMAATVPLILLFLAMIAWPVGPLRRIKQFSEEVVRPLLAECSVVDLFGISTLAGFGEEMLFRGVMQSAFAHWMPVWGAVALASILFGLMHAITATYALMASLMGAYLGWLWLYTGNLLVPILVHLLYDFVVLLYLLRCPGSAGTPVPSDEAETDRAETPAGRLD